MYTREEVMKMSATFQGVGVASPNLAFTLIMRSVQQIRATPSTPPKQRGIRSPTPALASSYRQVDVKA